MSTLTSTDLPTYKRTWILQSVPWLGCLECLSSGVQGELGPSWPAQRGLGPGVSLGVVWGWSCTVPRASVGGGVHLTCSLPHTPDLLRAACWGRFRTSAQVSRGPGWVPAWELCPVPGWAAATSRQELGGRGLFLAGLTQRELGVGTSLL